MMQRISDLKILTVLPPDAGGIINLSVSGMDIFVAAENGCYRIKLDDNPNRYSRKIEVIKIPVNPDYSNEVESGFDIR